METKHTKGEWSFSSMKGTEGHCFLSQVWDSEGRSLAIINSRYGEKEATANAKLIAACPDLLRSLIYLIADLERNDNDHLNRAALINEAKAAIEKATK